MIKFLIYATLILLLSFLVFFFLWRHQLGTMRKLKKECEDLTSLLESYKKIVEVQTKERIEIEKSLQDSVGTGSSDSFNSSIDLLQKLSDRGKSRS